MLSEAKHLGLSLGDRSKSDQRFFALLRMTFATGKPFRVIHVIAVTK